jgi:hypothetical protein
MGSSQSSHADPLKASSSAPPSSKAAKSGIMRVGGRKAATNNNSSGGGKKDYAKAGKSVGAGAASAFGGKGKDVKAVMGASFASGGDGGSAPHGLVGSFVSEPTAFFLHPEDFPSEEVRAGGPPTKAISEEEEKKVMGAVFEEEDPTFVEEEEEDGEEADAVLVPSDVSTASVASGEDEEDEDEGASRERSVLWRGASLSLCESESLREMRWRRGRDPCGRGCVCSARSFRCLLHQGEGLIPSF